MSDVWSFNTTVRNPDRMENMLRALREMEGAPFDLKGQEKFFGLQIKKRLYKPTKSTLGDQQLIAAVHSGGQAEELDDATVGKILDKYRNNVDASARGRTAAGILNRFGLCVAQQSKGPVVITELGKRWLDGEIDDEELFTKFFLKWQYPNPIESGYGEFDIKPFIGVVSLIDKVNKKWESLGNNPVGLSKEGYQMFIPSLTKSREIERYADEIVDFRNARKSKSGKELSNFVSDYAKSRARRVYGPSKPISKALSDLRDYTDSSIRYFRMSGLISLRGGDTHVDISKDKKVEVSSIIKTIGASAADFDSYQKYFEYLSDINSLVLPWQNEDDLEKISIQLSRSIEEETKDINVDSSQYLSGMPGQTSKQQVDSLREAINDVRIKKLRNLKHNVKELQECIDRLGTITGKQYEALTARPSLDLEWYVARALMVLNDAVEILPSFKMGDDGLPTGFRANLSDVECRYASFGLTVEPTLRLGRDQWVAEGQPVMRHLRDFEDKNESGVAFCIFIAPFIHRDTLNTFWGSNKFGFEGKRQNIIPLTIEQFIVVLKGAKDKIEDGNLNHGNLKSLLQLFSGGVDQHDNSNEWIAGFPECIESWAPDSL